MGSAAGDGPRATTLLVVTDRASIRDLVELTLDRRQNLGDAPVSLLVCPLDESRIPNLSGAEVSPVVVVDLLPSLPLALRVCGWIHAHYAEAPLVGLACCPNDFTREGLDALEDLGIASFLDLSEDGRSLIRAIENVAHGYRVVHLQTAPPQAGLAADALPRPNQSRTVGTATVNPRELAVLNWLARGLKEEQIAEREHMSARTVRRVIADLERKLGASSIFQLAMKATLLGFIPQ